MVEPRGLLGQVRPLGHVRRERGRLGVEPGGGREVAVLLVEVRRHGPVARQVGVDLGECSEPGPRPVGLAHGDGPVEAYDGAAGQRQQLVVPLHDLHPVGLLGRACVGVERGDRGLQLELAALLEGEGTLQDPYALLDEGAVPAAAVLVGERHQGAVRPQPGRAARVVEQHQGEQPVGLRMGEPAASRASSRVSRIASAARSTSPE